jgi:hypothetical protein
VLTPLQKKIGGAGIACLALLACCLPWTYTVTGANGFHREKPAGYHFIFDPPRPEQEGITHGVKVDTPRVAIPMTVVVLATVAAVLLTGTKRRGHDELKRRPPSGDGEAPLPPVTTPPAEPVSASAPPAVPSPDTGAEWYVLSQGVESGPFTTEELKAKAAAGPMNAGDFVSRGRHNWRSGSKAGDLDFLRDLLRAPGVPKPGAGAGRERTPPPASPPESDQTPASKTQGGRDEPSVISVLVACFCFAFCRVLLNSEFGPAIAVAVIVWVVGRAIPSREKM